MEVEIEESLTPSAASLLEENEVTMEESIVDEEGEARRTSGNTGACGNKRKSKTKKERKESFKQRHPMLEPCKCKHLKCYERLSVENRSATHSNFWSRDYRGRCQFIQLMTEREIPKRRRRF